MASNNATFHAKITADASDFVKQVESANEALTGLVGAYGKAGKASKGNPGKSASKAQKDTGKEAKAVWDKAQSAADDYYANIVQEERKVAAVQKKAADLYKTAGRRDKLEGPVRAPVGFGGSKNKSQKEQQDTAKLIAGAKQLNALTKERARSYETVGDKIFET